MPKQERPRKGSTTSTLCFVFNFLRVAGNLQYIDREDEHNLLIHLWLTRLFAHIQLLISIASCKHFANESTHPGIQNNAFFRQSLELLRPMLQYREHQLTLLPKELIQDLHCYAVGSPSILLLGCNDIAQFR